MAWVSPPYLTLFHINPFTLSVPSEDMPWKGPDNCVTAVCSPQITTLPHATQKEGLSLWPPLLWKPLWRRGLVIPPISSMEAMHDSGLKETASIQMELSLRSLINFTCTGQGSLQTDHWDCQQRLNNLSRTSSKEQGWKALHRRGSLRLLTSPVGGMLQGVWDCVDW